MPTNVRLSKTEEKQAREKCIEINKILVNNGYPPVRESELIHKILEKTLPYVKANIKGEINIK